MASDPGGFKRGKRGRWAQLEQINHHGPGRCHEKCRLVVLRIRLLVVGDDADDVVGVVDVVDVVDETCLIKDDISMTWLN